MRKSILISFVGVGLMTSVAVAKRDPDVDKTLKREYPDAQTQVMNVKEVNGVKVSFVNVKTKDGEATAQVTEHGDFLNYGLPRGKEGPYMEVVKKNTQGLFKETPSDVRVFRQTQYVVDLPGPQGQSYQATFDAVGRLTDMTNQRDIERQLTEEKQTPASGPDADKAQQFAKQYFPEIEVEGVYKSNAGENIYNVKTKTGNVAVSSTGQLYAVREMIPQEEMPAPVSEAVKAMLASDKINKVYRNEMEYYQFNETTPAGEAVTIRMRTNGDIVKVITPSAEQEATLAAQKQGPDAGAAPVAPKKKAKKPAE